MAALQFYFIFNISFVRARAELAIKFVKNASGYCNSDEEFDIIAAMKGLVA